MGYLLKPSTRCWGLGAKQAPHGANTRHPTLVSYAKLLGDLVGQQAKQLGIRRSEAIGSEGRRPRARPPSQEE